MANPTGNCHHWLNDLSDYLDGEASAALCAAIERHMRDCENCRVVVDTLRRTVRLYHDLPAARLPADARARLYRALDLRDYLAGS